MDQEFINELAEKLSKLGTKRPLGFHYTHPFGTVPPDSIQCNGAEYNRSLYSDFFAYATKQGWVKTEAEWQEIATQNNGYCSYYSDGDGSTTFRTPKFAPFMQVALASGNVGNYHEAGIPNITGRFTLGNNSGHTFGIEGPAFKREENTRAYSACADANDANWVSLDASRCNGAFGNSDTVQPESSEWMICVVVFGVATNVGSADVSNVMSAVAQVQANPNLQGQAHIVETWKSDSYWYRVWSDGLVEQGGMIENTTESGDSNLRVSLPKVMSSSSYYVGRTMVHDTIKTYGEGLAMTYGIVNTRSISGFTIKTPADNRVNSVVWYVCGY